MSWKLKALAVLVALMAIPLHALWLSALLFLYAGSGLIVRGPRSGRRGGAPTASGSPPQLQGTPAAPAVRFKGRLGHSRTRALGVVFLGLALVAVAEGGTLSPFFFGGVGAALLFWGAPLAWMRGIGSLRAIEHSVLLRGLDRVHWFALAEVKLATRQAGKALGGIDETLLVEMGEGGPSIFVVMETTSLTMRGAEESLLERLQELARISAPLGGYLLPVDSAKAAGGVLGLSARAVELDSRGWPSSLSTTDYDLLAVQARRGGFVHAVGAYKREGAGGRNAALLPARQKLSRPALLWEVFEELGRRVEWQKPDAYTTFLASVCATGGETIGERVQAGEGSTEGTQEVLVQSLGTPPVRMSRAQLRAIARVYP